MILELSSDPGSRAAVAFGGIALLGAFAAAGRVLFPADSASRVALWSAVRSAFVYLALGLATRFAIQHHKSRLQILVLLALVGLIETLRMRPRTLSIRCGTWLAGSVAVFVGVLAAKWVLEPGALSAAFMRLLDDL